MGVRLALGTTSARLRTRFVQHGLVTVAVRSVFGVVCAASTAKVLGSLIEGAKGMDLKSYGLRNCGERKETQISGEKCNAHGIPFQLKKLAPTGVRDVDSEVLLAQWPRRMVGSSQWSPGFPMVNRSTHPTTKRLSSPTAVAFFL